MKTLNISGSAKMKFQYSVSFCLCSGGHQFPKKKPNITIKNHDVQKNKLHLCYVNQLPLPLETLCLSVNLNKWSKREDNYKGVNGPSILNWYNTVRRSSFQTTHRRHSSLPQSGLLPVLNKEVDTGSTHLNSIFCDKIQNSEQIEIRLDYQNCVFSCVKTINQVDAAAPECH